MRNMRTQLTSSWTSSTSVREQTRIERSKVIRDIHSLCVFCWWSKILSWYGPSICCVKNIQQSLLDNDNPAWLKNGPECYRTVGPIQVRLLVSKAIIFMLQTTELANPMPIKSFLQSSSYTAVIFSPFEATHPLPL